MMFEASLIQRFSRGSDFFIDGRTHVNAPALNPTTVSNSDSIVFGGGPGFAGLTERTAAATARRSYKSTRPNLSPMTIVNPPTASSCTNSADPSNDQCQLTS